MNTCEFNSTHYKFLKRHHRLTFDIDLFSGEASLNENLPIIIKQDKKYKKGKDKK